MRHSPSVRRPEEPTETTSLSDWRPIKPGAYSGQPSLPGYQDGSNEVQCFAKGWEDIDFRSETTRQYYPLLAFCRGVDEVRWSFIRICHNDNPPIVRGVVATTAAHICCGDVTGRCQPLSKKSILIRCEEPCREGTNSVPHAATAFPLSWQMLIAKAQHVWCIDSI